MQSNEADIRAARSLINDATPAYLVKLMEFGAEYSLSDEQRRKAEQIAGEIGRDGRVSGVLRDFADRLDHVPELQDFAARVRGFFLNDGRYAQFFSDKAETVEQAGAEPDGRLSPGAMLTIFIGTYAAAVAMLRGVFGSVAPEADPVLAEMLAVIPWAFGFPIAGSVVLFFARLLGMKK